MDSVKKRHIERLEEQNEILYKKLISIVSENQFLKDKLKNERSKNEQLEKKLKWTLNFIRHMSDDDICDCIDFQILQEENTIDE